MPMAVISGAGSQHRLANCFHRSTPVVTPQLPFELVNKCQWIRLPLRVYGSQSGHHERPVMLMDISGFDSTPHRVMAVMKAFRQDFDFNNDGNIEKMERVRGQLLMSQAMELDQNRDGTFSEQELCGSKPCRWWQSKSKPATVPSLSWS